MPDNPDTHAYRRVLLEREGGFAGPIKRPPVIVDIASMSAVDAAEITIALASVDFPGLPGQFPGNPAPDAMETTLVVEAVHGEFRVTFQEGDGHPPELDTIAEWVWARRAR